MTSKKAEFSEGDVVYFKSGSPRLTIISIDRDAYKTATVEVGWFVFEQNSYKCVRLPITSIVKEKSDKSV